MSAPARLAHHAELLARSAIADDVAAERGYWSATEPRQLERWFSSPAQRRLVPALVIPTFDTRGEVAFCQLRPDAPRVVDGKTRKYEIPRGARMVVDVPPRVRPVLGNPNVPLVITEGARKADAAVSVGLHAVDLVGVWTWRGRNDDGGLTALPDFEQIAFNGRVIYLAFDSDAMAKREVHQALERLAGFLGTRGAELRFVYLPSTDGGTKTGLDDFLADGHSRDDVLALATDMLRPLAGEPRQAARPQTPPVDVDGAALLEEVRDFITRYLVLPSAEVADLLALWVAHTHASESAFATPYLRIVSATPESGKTLLLEILAAIARNGWHAINPSPAILYRKIDRDCPTLLLDEMDNYPLDERRDALSVLNAGYKRGATVDRCNERGDLLTFSCFCPKAYAGLDTRSLVPALLSRSITVRLERKSRSEHRQRWLAQLVGPDAERLRERCAAWAHHRAERLAGATPDLPAELGDRGCEVWWALLAIADDAGGGWAERARRAAVVLSTGGDAVDDMAPELQLLADIRDAFGDEQTIFTKVLLEKLNALDESPWGERRGGLGLDARGLSRLLRPFRIKPRSVRVPGVAGTSKGYHVDQFADAFARYLPSPPQMAQAAQAAHPNPRGAGDVPDVPDVPDTEGTWSPEEQARAERLFAEYGEGV